MAVVQSREKWLDALKGFCMILVLFSHANAIPPVGGFLCACYMQVFFFVAGYTYKEHTSEIFQNFILRKFKRLMVPYFGYSTILLILYAIHQRLNPAQIAWGG